MQKRVMIMFLGFLPSLCLSHSFEGPSFSQIIWGSRIIAVGEVENIYEKTIDIEILTWIRGGEKKSNKEFPITEFTPFSPFFPLETKFKIGEKYLFFLLEPDEFESEDFKFLKVGSKYLLDGSDHCFESHLRSWAITKDHTCENNLSDSILIDAFISFEECIQIGFNNKDGCALNRSTQHLLVASLQVFRSSEFSVGVGSDEDSPCSARSGNGLIDLSSWENTA